ncbi:MAG: hypothetical protein R3A52_00575 [Polyangiales bacterium]
MFTELGPSIIAYAELRRGGGLAVFPGTCNVYERDLPGPGESAPYGEAWRACSSTALRYRVEVPGCAPIEGVWTWDDNYYPGILGKSFEIPVRLTCLTPDIDASIAYPDVQRAFPPERPPYDVPNDVGRPSSD